MNFRHVTRCCECDAIYSIHFRLASVMNWATKSDGSPYHMCGECGKNTLFYDTVERHVKTGVWWKPWTWFSEKWVHHAKA